MINAIFIFNAKGDVLMSKFYKQGVKKNVSDVFRIQVINAAARHPAGADVRLPLLTLGSTLFLYIRSDQLWIVAVARSNQDSLAILEYLYTFLALLRLLFAKNAALTEEAVVGNFSTIFDILDETLEFGYPTNTEPAYLASVVPGLAGTKVGKSDLKKIGSSATSALANSMDVAYDTSKVSWRDTGIKYRKNEVFLNVNEKVHVLMNAAGDVLRSHIDGTINMTAHVSGMPVCRFAFSEERLHDGLLRAITLDDFKFHKCVDLAKYDSERVIQFTPPDYAFQLMTYHIGDGFTLPFKVVPHVRENGNKLDMQIKLESTFSSKLAATAVELKVVVPPGFSKNSIVASNGRATFDPQENKVLWKLNKIFGSLEHALALELDTQSAAAGWKPKITLDFTIELHIASGLQVKLLNVVEKANYRTIKWVKYCTQSGSYEVRL